MESTVIFIIMGGILCFIIGLVVGVVLDIGKETDEEPEIDLEKETRMSDFFEGDQPPKMVVVGGVTYVQSDLGEYAVTQEEFDQLAPGQAVRSATYGACTVIESKSENFEQIRAYSHTQLRYVYIPREDVAEVVKSL